MAARKRWKDRCRYRHCLFKRRRVCLDEEMNTRDISVEPGSRENANKDSINRLLLASYLLISSFEKLRIICISRSLSGMLVQMPHCKTRRPCTPSLSSEFWFLSRILIQMPHCTTRSSSRNNFCLDLALVLHYPRLNRELYGGYETIVRGDLTPHSV